MLLLGTTGPLLTVRAVQREFDSVDPSGMSDPGMVSKQIGHVLIPSFVGLAIAIPGCALMISCLVLQLKERKKSEV